MDTRFVGTPLLTADEVAALFQVKRVTVYKWVKEGRLPAEAVVLLGRTVRFRRREIEKLTGGDAA